MTHTAPDYSAMSGEDLASLLLSIDTRRREALAMGQREHDRAAERLEKQFGAETQAIRTELMRRGYLLMPVRKRG